ncbi:MAG: alpha/beta hydrolase [Deltaproteobacteria bacterium]|nr:alpha/beta hydrolase [Deltaproteobacteria bacterium]
MMSSSALRIAHGSDGEPLAFSVQGPAGKTPMLTAHGLVSSVHHWMFFTPHFSGERPIISWEYRGHGGQPSPQEMEISVSQFADDAHAVWQTAVAEPAVVVGLSFGVQVALEIWRRHPECVKALVLICGTPGRPLDRLTSNALLRRSAIAIVQELAHLPGVSGALLSFLRSRPGLRLARELAYLSGGAHRDACPPEVLEGLFKHVASMSPDLIAATVAAYLEHDANDMLSSITVPTLIIAADRDQLTPVAVAERMQRTIANSKLVVFKGHSHLVQVERPREVHAAIATFLEEHAL